MGETNRSERFWGKNQERVADRSGRALSEKKGGKLKSRENPDKFKKLVNGGMTAPKHLE